jgi:hypothetical protein
MIDRPEETPTLLAHYTISKNGLTLWTGEYVSKEAAVAAYIKDLGDEALAYDSVDPDWKDELEIDEIDPTEALRREMIETGQPLRNLAVAGQRWTTEQMSREFIVHSFCAPFVIVTRKADGAKGSLEFTHRPRFYFNWVADR